MVGAEAENSLVDRNSENDIMLPEEVARYLRKSPSWVYKNWRILGGVKLRGSLLFPGKEDLYERLFSKREGMEVRLHSSGCQVHKCLVQDKIGSQAGGGKEKGGNTESAASASDRGDPNRHGILGTGEQKA